MKNWEENKVEELLDILKGLKPGVDFENEKNLIEDRLLDSLDVMNLTVELNDEFDIEKGRFSFRLTAPYSEERREATRRYARENSTTNLLK